jgi:hypothetical protein
VTYDLDSNSFSRKAVFEYDSNKTSEENICAHLNKHSKDIYFRKYRDFLDENEYRIILVDRSKIRNQYLFCPLENSLKAVILGDRCHEIYHDIVKKLCNNHSSIAYVLKYSKIPYIKEL